MKTWAYGEFSVKDIKVRGKVTEMQLQTTEKPLGSKTPGNCDTEVVNHEKAGDLIGLEIQAFGAYGATGDYPTLFQLDASDVTPIPGARKLGTAQLVSERRAEVATQGGGMAVKYGLKLRVHGDDTLMQFLRDNKKPWLALFPTQYELPVQDTEPKTRKKKDKHDSQQTLDEAKPTPAQEVAAAGTGEGVDPLKEIVGELPPSPTIAERAEQAAADLAAGSPSMAERAANAKRKLKAVE